MPRLFLALAFTATLSAPPGKPLIGVGVIVHQANYCAMIECFDETIQPLEKRGKPSNAIDRWWSSTR